MSFTDVMYGPLGQVNNNFQANLAGNAAAMQAQQGQAANIANQGAINQAALNNAYGPQGFGGQTAYYAGQGAAYGRAVPGEIYGGGGQMGSVFDTGAAPFNDYGLNGTFNTATGNVGQSPGMAPGFGGFNNLATPQNPISWYVNGGYDPFNPATYGGSAQQNLGTGYPGMNMPQGTSSGGYDPQWGGTSSYPQGQQSSAPSSLLYGSSGTNFDTAGYFEANPDALEAYRSGSWGISDPTQFAEAHFLAAHNNEGSWRSGWAPSNNPDFNAAGYYEANPDALNAFASSGFKDPTAFAEQHFRDAHNAEGGYRTGWAPSGSNVGFDAAEYYLANPDALQAFMGSNYRDPTAFAEQHFLDAHKAEGGWRSGWAPDNPNFNAAGYYEANPDALNAFASSGYKDPTAFAEQHLLAAHNNPAEGGAWRTGWAPSNPDFDVQGYFAANPDALQAYGEGSWGINDPTRFAEAHLAAAHANPAEGGGYRGGWMASSDPSFDTEGWFGAHPEAYQSYFDKSNPYTNPTAYAEMNSPSNDYSTFQKGPSYNWQASIPAGRSDPATINAIYRAAGTTGLSPAALAAMMNMESTWDPKSSMLGNYGLPQLSANMWGDYGGNFGGMDFNTFKGATGDRQIDAYADWLMKSNNLNKGGIDVASQTDPVMQAALLQAIQFGGNAMDWRNALAGGNMNVPVTKSPQAGDLGTTSINDMYGAYDKMMNAWHR